MTHGSPLDCATRVSSLGRPHLDAFVECSIDGWPGEYQLCNWDTLHSRTCGAGHDDIHRVVPWRSVGTLCNNRDTS